MSSASMGQHALAINSCGKAHMGLVETMHLTIQIPWCLCHYKLHYSGNVSMPSACSVLTEVLVESTACTYMLHAEVLLVP